MKKILLSLLGVLMVPSMGFCYYGSVEDSTSYATDYNEYKSQDNPNGSKEIKAKLNMRRPRVGTIIQMPVAKMRDEESNGWMLCDGRSLNRYDDRYKNLFNVLGYTYGGSGSLFNLPNLMNQGQFLRGYKAGVSGSMGKTQATMARSPYTAEFWTMTKNSNNYGGSIKRESTKSTHQIKLQQYSGLGAILHSNEKTSYGKRAVVTYNNKNANSGSGDAVRPTNYAVSYWIMTEGDNVNQTAPVNGGSENTGLAEAYADLQAMKKMLNQYYDELEKLAEELTSNSDTVQEVLQEAADAQTLLDEAKRLKQACLDGEGLNQGDNNGNSASSTSMSKEMANWMDSRGLAYDKTGGDLINNSREWDVAIKSLEDYRDSCTANMDEDLMNKYEAKQKQISDLEKQIEAQQKYIQNLANK